MIGMSGAVYRAHVLCQNLFPFYNGENPGFFT